MTNRVDSLLAELEARYPTGDGFVDTLRPMAERILDAGTPEQHRPALLEMLAETCDRQIQIERNCARAIEAWRGFIDQLKILLDPPAPPEAGPEQA